MFVLMNMLRTRAVNGNGGCFLGVECDSRTSFCRLAPLASVCDSRMI
jgi:hypothetical protein